MLVAFGLSRRDGKQSRLHHYTKLAGAKYPIISVLTIRAPRSKNMISVGAMIRCTLYSSYAQLQAETCLHEAER